MKSSIISSEGNVGTMATTSLLEGTLGVELPKSKINAAAHRHALTKNQCKQIPDEGENITISDDDITS